MQRGSSSVLLVEELVLTLDESGKLLALAFGANDCTPSLEAMGSLTVYTYYLQQFRNTLAMSAAAIDDQGRNANQFLIFGDDSPVPDRSISLAELETDHDKLRQNFNRTRLAYDDYIIRNRPLKLLLNVVEMYWSLATANLNNAIKTCSK